FFALGQSRYTLSSTSPPTPTILICTSGSAVANWLPAVVEANHAALPLLLLSADRPPELHQCGANQTIEQEGLFGVQVRATHPLPPPDEITHPRREITRLLTTLTKQLTLSIPGPIHLNIPFREPLLPLQPEQMNWSAEPFPPLFPPLPPSPLPDTRALGETIHHQAGLILCGEMQYGEDFHPLLTELAQRLDCPVLLDPLSNLRWGAATHPRLLSHYDGFLRGWLKKSHHHPDWVIQFGDFPLSKTVANWLTKCPPPTFVTIQNQRLWSDPERLSSEHFESSSTTFATSLLSNLQTDAHLPHWSQPFIEQEQQALHYSPPHPEQCEQQLLHQLLEQLPAETHLFSGNSMVIRDIDGWLPARTAPLYLFANRGASGIDGNLSTACGIRSLVDPEIPVVALLGDLTLFHDLNALSTVSQIGGNFTLLVINNGGGNIFSYLPPAPLPEFESLWLTPSPINFEQAAKLYNLAYQRIDSDPEAPPEQPPLSTLFQENHPKLIEWVVDRTASVQAHQRYWESFAWEQ
ncbi:MAG: 2-succinyl-5-enolpyruvyl-6-hydroxy-3-cyclohexene-1-carboxylic-acid synthase, partial [Gammaproteobacteria bacterium]|nr:2-succinyl-5-enolpyruvyl-6-hydroxy-3-cyclohexene-1-carboxylic-acid synthase [Gammaproteobacteria bacterium]